MHLIIETIVLDKKKNNKNDKTYPMVICFCCIVSDMAIIDIWTNTIGNDWKNLYLGFNGKILCTNNYI